VSWDARVARIDSLIDPKTRTVGVIVAVDEPYKRATSGVKPPLVKGMYCEVELRGKARPNSLVIPRSALQGDGDETSVYLVGPDSRLVRRPVLVDFLQSDFAVIRGGLTAGERVVISDLIPAIPGMLLIPKIDKAAARSLMDSATGRGLVE